MQAQPMQPLFGGGPKIPGTVRKHVSKIIWGLILLVLLVIAIKVILVAKFHLAPPVNPVAQYGSPVESLVHHWGHTLVASNSENWISIQFKKDKRLKLSLDTPKAEDYPDALAQLRGRLIDLNGHRGPEKSLREIFRLNPRGAAIEVRAVPGRFDEILLIEDHIPQ